MLEYMAQMTSIHSAGIREIWSGILDNWIGPLFIAAVAVFSIVFIKDRAWMKLIGFIGIAAVVGVLVFAGDDLFGSDGSLKNVAQDTAEGVGNVIFFKFLG